jgi:hypothetical protein
MATAKCWTVDVFIDEADDYTYAKVRLHTDTDTHPVGTGHAKRNPVDRDVPAIGDEVAVARALGDLSRRMLVAATDDIAAVTHQPAALRS